jgi:hypothetical protein
VAVRATALVGVVAVVGRCAPVAVLVADRGGGAGRRVAELVVVAVVAVVVLEAAVVVLEAAVVVLEAAVPSSPR